MNIADMVFVFEFFVTFGALMAFCFWQLHSLNKLDREDAERNARAEETSD
ncbi:MAG: hypothetical protein AAGA53_03650 [Pseudomonadota bacterium]